MNFKIWLEQSISNFLSKIDVKFLKNTIKQFLSNSLNGRDLDVATNMFAYILINEKIISNQEKNSNLIIMELEKIWNPLKDFLIANLSTKRSIFVNPISLQELKELNVKYHRNLTIGKNLRKGPQGLPVINVEEKLKELKETKINLPEIFEPKNWSGWSWVSLGCGYSREEGSAGGHCGNIGTRRGDNIFSLRDPRGRVLLTFIVNTITGTLGEAKGINNKKPTKEFHPPIVSLIISNFVRNYSKSSHENEEEGIADFHPDDLKYIPELYEMVKKHLNGEKNLHDVPSNYLPLKWLEQWNDEKLNQLNDDQKLNVFVEIIKILSNHKPLSYNSYDREENHENVNINFSFKKFTKSVFSKIKNPKQAVFIFEVINELYDENKLEHYDDVGYFKPEILNKIKISGGLDDFYKNFSWSNSETENFRKKDQIDIDDELLISIAKHIDSLKLNPRELADFIRTLEEAGYREEYKLENKLGTYLKKESKTHNIFEKMINKNVDLLIKDIISGKKMPDNVFYPLLLTVRKNVMEKYSGDPIEFGLIPGVELVDELKKESDGANLIDLFIKQDILEKESAIVSLSFSFPKFKKEHIDDYLSNKNPWSFSNEFSKELCISNVYKKEFSKEIKKIARSLNLAYENSKYSLNFIVKVKSKQFFKNYLSTRNPFNYDLINKIKKTLNNLFNRKYTLEKFIKNHFEEIDNCIKEKTKNRYNIRRHNKKRFSEWIENKYGI